MLYNISRSRLATLALVVLVAGAVIWYGIGLLLATKPFSNEIKTEVVDVRTGTSMWFVLRSLKSKSLIRQPFWSLLYLKLNGRTLQAGVYYLSPSQSTREILRIISSGKVSEHRITIPEGWRIEQIAQLLENRNIVKSSALIEAAMGKEGRLFPDTYQFSLGVSAGEIVEKMMKNFEKRTEGLKVSDDKLIIASIIEREAKHDEDRAKMAGVYANRLQIGMPLEADPTVQYALDTERLKSLTAPASAEASAGRQKLKEFKFWQAPTADQNKNFESSFNTYRRKGLPASPICNPGLASIKAAINPEQHDFYFFFNLPDGATIYSKTREEHEANRARYGPKR